MRRSMRVGLIAFPLTVCAGVALGDSTVSAMQVRREPVESTLPDGRPSEFDLGRAWAKAHSPNDADSCPQITLLFHAGCVSATRN